MHFLFNIIQDKFHRLFIKHTWVKKNRHNNTYVANRHNDCLFPVNRVSVGEYTYGPLRVLCYNKTKGVLSIGSFCSIAQDVTFLIGENHPIDHLSTFPFKNIFLNQEDAITKGNIIIEDDVWIGFGCTILSGVKISQGTIIAAGSVVTSSTEAYSIVGGVPAKMIKRRFSNELIEKITTIKYKKLNRDLILNNLELLYTPISEASIDKIIDLFK